jgi:hypothetical protein
MQVASLRWKLAREQVRETPDVQGVFSLWSTNECVYIGYTPWNRSLRDCLRELLALQQEGAIKASHFTWETTPTPKTREGDLLAVCIDKLGRLPRYNREDSPLRPPRSCVTDLRAKKSGPNPG